VIERIGKQLLDPRAAELARRKADTVNYQEANPLADRAVILVGRSNLPDLGQQSRCIHPQQALHAGRSFCRY
jgi:hypothetical protein